MSVTGPESLTCTWCCIYHRIFACSIVIHGIFLSGRTLESNNVWWIEVETLSAYVMLVGAKQRIVRAVGTGIWIIRERGPGKLSERECDWGKYIAPIFSYSNTLLRRRQCLGCCRGQEG